MAIGERFMQLSAGQLLAVQTINGSTHVSVEGTVTPFRHHNRVLTAAHCVTSESATFVYQLPIERKARVVNRIERHEKADLAILFGDDEELDAVQPTFPIFEKLPQGVTEGMDFLAFGYPVEGSEEQKGVGRIFKGHYQRMFGYRDSAGRSYFAAELSVPAPAGLSGGPVVPVHDRGTLDGIVTANHDSYAITDSVDEIDADGNRLRIEGRRIISYGVAALLVGQDGWINEMIPPT